MKRMLYKTHFQAYDRPARYEMPDYSVLPREEDFRRTLYWNPSVKADRRGRATIEFYNNSSCQQLVVSTEGITDDGTAMVSEY